jgi:hypothetical protein
MESTMTDYFSMPVEQYSVQAELLQGKARLLVNTDNYKAICESNNHSIIGVRKSLFSQNTDNTTGLLTNNEGVAVLKKLYEQLFGRKGNVLKKYPNSEGNNWGLALIGDHEMDMNAWLYLQMQEGSMAEQRKNKDKEIGWEGFPHSFISELVHTMQRRNSMEGLQFTDIFDEDDARTVLSDYTILLAMLNGYDYDDEMKFYVLVQRKERDEEAEIANIFTQDKRINEDDDERKAEEFTNRLYLTLDSFTVSLSRYGEKFSQPINKNREVLEHIILNDIDLATSFRRSLLQFARVMVDFSDEDISQTELVALSLDIHNVNRDASRIKNDPKHARDLTERIHNANNYYRDNRNHTLSDLISYIFHSTFIDLRDMENIRDKVRAILTKKQPYRSIVQWLHPFRKDHYPRYHAHVQAQVEVYERTCTLLGTTPE